MNTENLIRSYYRKVNAADLEGLLQLFSDDAIFVLPDGRTVQGMDAIKQMYVGVFAHGGPQPKPINIVHSPEGATAEVEVHLADGTVHRMASFFQLGAESKFSGVKVYKQG